MEIWRETAIGLGTLCACWIGVYVVRSARRLNAGVKAAKEEQEKQSGAVDPYAAMASLYAPPPKEPSRYD